MESKELRIGNWVKVFDHKPKVEFDTIATITQYGWETVNGYNGIEPILITEEWLLKLGFELYVDEFNIWSQKPYNRENHSVQAYKNGKFIYVASSDSNEAYFKKIQYIHQLQNLYFALAGKELEIKL